MNKISRRLFLSAGTATAAVVASQIAGIRTTTAQTKELNIYSSRHYNTDNELYRGFERQAGVKVNLIEGEADALIERIKSEGRNSKADILITVDAGRLWRAQQMGLFTPVSSSVLTKKIPAYLRDPQGNWFSFSKRARVIMYNKNKANASKLSTYENLTNSEWRKNILIRSSSNIYNQSLVAWLISIHGEREVEQWCRGLVANFARPPQGNDTAQIEAAASGAGELAIANTYYLAGLATNKDPAKRAIYDTMKVFFPNQKTTGTHINVSGGGVVKTAPNKDVAIKFLEYLTSNQAQNFFAQGNNEYPVVSGIALDEAVAKFGKFKESTVNVASFGPNLAKAVQVMDRAGWK